MVLGFREDKKIIIKKAKKEKTRCLLKKIYDSFKEKDNTIPITKRIEINIKLILSISFHQMVKLK